MTTATPAQQTRLLDLQRVDTVIRQLEHKRAHLLEQVALDENAATLAVISSEYAQNRERLTQLERDQRRYEGEIAQLESRRKTQDAQLYSGRLSSEREVEAIRSELNQMKGRKADLEDALLDVMVEGEELSASVAAQKERHAELTSSVEELTVGRDVAAEEIDAELATARKDRSTIVDDVPGPVVAQYEALRERKQGVGVARLEGKTCDGCRLQLTQVELEDIREDAQRGLAFCAQCGRILVPVKRATPN